MISLHQGNDQQGDPMIDVRVMPLPTVKTKANIDITVILGELFVYVSV